MKNKKLITGIFSVILLTTLFISNNPVYAGEISLIRQEEKVQVFLQEKGTNDAKKENLLPDEEVAYVLSVLNKSVPVYIRVKVDVTSERGFDDSILTGISADWQKKGQYFYYRKALSKGEETIFCKSVKLPDFDNSSGEEFSISSEAEAIQAEGFLPDFASDTPWGDEKELDFTGKVPAKGNDSSDEKSSSGSNSSGNGSDGSGSSSGSASGNSSSGSSSSGSGSKKSSSSGGGGSGTVRKGVSVSSDKAGIGPGFASGQANSSMYKNPYGATANTFTDGQWQLIDKDQNHWSFLLTDGTAAKGGWLYLKNPYGKDDQGKASWFKFNADGRMETGWILSDDGNWYFAHDISDGNLGVLAKGWQTNSQDNKKYYLHPDTGHMLTGWQKIGKKYYYFATADDIPKQTWFFQTNVGKWLYDAIGFRSYGSMYQNERTPDGRLVDAEGAYIPG